ncbi:MAG: bifunctional DNA primase/polymerase, partial [Planctomycetota bacterium]
MKVTKEQMLGAALRYAELGYPVFPCTPGGKTPLTPHGFKDATTNAGTIRSWWAKHPQANIGIPTAGLLVIDVDGVDNPWPGETELSEALARGPVSLTPRGGRHHVFRQPNGKEWKNTTGRIARGVDTRANGGYIVVPPSVVEGKPYRWAETLELDVSPDRLPEPPEWLVAKIDGQGLSSGDPHPDGNPIPAGQRNATLARLAGAMRRVGMSRDEILAALARANRDRCRPPLSPWEVEKVASSICRYEPDQVIVAVVENHWAQDAAPPDPADEGPKAVSDPGLPPDDLLRVPGFISEVMDYCLATAPYPNPVMAFCGALALQAVLAGRKVRDPGDNRT